MGAPTPTTTHLEVPVDNLERVQVGDGLQYLPDDVAGVPLRVVALVQDPVEDLPTGGPANSSSAQIPPGGGTPNQPPQTPQTYSSRKMKYSLRVM